MPTPLTSPSPSLADPEIAGVACFTLKGPETITEEFDLVLSLRLRSLAVFRKPGRTGGSRGSVSPNHIRFPISAHTRSVVKSHPNSPRTFPPDFSPPTQIVLTELCLLLLPPPPPAHPENNFPDNEAVTGLASSPCCSFSVSVSLPKSSEE